MKILHINTNFINNSLHQNMTDTLNKCGTDSNVAVPTCDFKARVIEPKDYVKICECFNKYDRVLYHNKQRKIISHIDKNFDVKSFADAFCNEIKNAGYDAMLYSSKYYLENVWMHLENSKVWLAHYTSKTDYEGEYMMWQMTSSAKINGITENTVDIDILYK